MDFDEALVGAFEDGSVDMFQLLIRGFNDEALSGNWRGFRSSRLNQQYRVIYSVENGEMLVQVLEVTPYDYRRRS